MYSPCLFFDIYATALSFKATDSESNESGEAIYPLDNALITCVLYGRDSSLIFAHK